jgi:hypothetical protein
MRLDHVLLAALSLALPACFSTASTGADGGVVAPSDAASGPQSVGSPCDPAIATPCLVTGDDCLGVYCDPNALVCTEYVTDAGPPCNGGSAACKTTSDCDVGLTCGFPAGGGCSASGICIDVPIACEDDAAACPTGGTACGCSGQSVSFVIPGYATGPTPVPSGASSQGTCSSTDAGDEDAGDAGSGVPVTSG